MMKIIAIYFLGILLLSACAGTAPQIHQFENKEIIENSFDKIWSAVIETFAEKNISIATMEKASGFIATEPTKFSSIYADCGATPLGIEFATLGPWGKFNVFIKELSEKKYSIMVTVNYHVATDNIYYKECTSTGNLERWFISTVKQKLAQ
jgi:hypothetical protein